MSALSLRRTVLAAFAHPDDETFGPGATLARLAAEGHRVEILTATRGEAGTIGESASLGRERLAAVRTQELVDACRELGTRPPRQLSFPDSGLGGLEEDDLLRPLVGAVRETRPDVLLTFHDNGISGHQDHRTMTARLRTAFEAAADAKRWPELGPPHAVLRLWTYCVPESRARRVTMRQLHGVPDADLDAVIDTVAYIPHKRRAVAAHHTQRPFIDRLEENVGGLDEYWRSEAFVLAAARIPLPAGEKRPVADLMVGLGSPGSQLGLTPETRGSRG